MRTFGKIAVCVFTGLWVVLSQAQQPTAGGALRETKLDYNFDVRPILSDNCFRCHGPDAKSRQAGLRLDQSQSAYAQAIVPGKPEQSELIARVTSKDASYRMPPASVAQRTYGG